MLSPTMRYREFSPVYDLGESTRPHLARFAAMVTRIAGMPLIPTHDWTSQAAVAMCGGSADHAALVRLVDPKTWRLLHIGASAGADSSGSTGLLLMHAERLSRSGAVRAVGENILVPWSETTCHPFHAAGFDAGGIVHVSDAVHDRLGVSLHIYHRGSAVESIEAEIVRASCVILAASLRQFTSAIAEPDWLTARETAVLEHVVNGHTANEIAVLLERSPHTVHDHLKSIHRKTGATTRGELIAAAIGRRAIKPAA